jgi:hypothetical protein
MTSATPGTSYIIMKRKDARKYADELPELRRKQQRQQRKATNGQGLVSGRERTCARVSCSRSGPCTWGRRWDESGGHANGLLLSALAQVARDSVTKELRCTI